MAGWNDFPFEVKSVIVKHCVWHDLCKCYDRRHDTTLRQIASFADICKVVDVVPEMRQEVIKIAKKLTITCERIKNDHFSRPAQDELTRRISPNLSFDNLPEKAKFVAAALANLVSLMDKGLVVLFEHLDGEEPAYQRRFRDFFVTHLNANASIFLT